LIVAMTAAVACRSESPADKSNGRVSRVVCTTPSATELVASAGGADRIVGVDKFSSYPPAVKALPKVGDFLGPNVEQILRLQPDLVVLDAVQSKAATALDGAGIRTLVLEMHTVDHVRRGITTVGDALGTKQAAAETVRLMRDGIDASRARAESRGSERRRVLLIVDRELGGLGSLVAAGPGSYLDELLAIVGGENALAAAGIRYPKISPEEVLRSAPDVIIDAVHTTDAQKAANDWDAVSIPATKTGRVFVVNDSRFVTPGPRLVSALLEMEQMVYGEPPTPANSGQ
jgi:iron complex transport system substrate-binding protein